VAGAAQNATREAEMLEPRLMIVIASVRPGRVGLPVAEWFEGRARAFGEFEIDVADLQEIGLPFMDEPNHPRLRQYTQQHTKDWSARVDRADAFALVTPEYNYGVAPALKNAIDYLHWEWAYKPVGFVSYGGVSAGTRAAQMAKQVLSSLRVYTVTDAVSIPFVRNFLDDDERVEANETMEQAADAMLRELRRTAEALRALRDAD
jgi:NAD(P)H-dependent FMN reductase